MASGLTRLLRRLVASKGPAAVDRGSGGAVDYKGYTIRPESFKEGSHWITAGTISREFADGVQEHAFIRADMFPVKDNADECAIAKAKRLIDEMGERLFLEG